MVYMYHSFLVKAFSFQCMTKFTTNKKKKERKKIYILTIRKSKLKQQQQKKRNTNWKEIDKTDTVCKWHDIICRKSEKQH